MYYKTGIRSLLFLQYNFLGATLSGPTPVANKTVIQEQLILKNLSFVPQKTSLTSLFLSCLTKPHKLPFSHSNQVRLADFQFGNTGFQLVSIGIELNAQVYVIRTCSYVKK